MTKAYFGSKWARPKNGPLEQSEEFTKAGVRVKLYADRGQNLWSWKITNTGNGSLMGTGSAVNKQAARIEAIKMAKRISKRKVQNNEAYLRSNSESVDNRLRRQRPHIS